jgi:uncharacterized metal-binding protein
MENKTPCACGEGEYIVLTCSGASDVGYISDQVARKLSRHKVRKMSCLALVASGNQDKIESFKKSNVLVIDGCSDDCGRKVMEKAGITNYKYARLTDMGYEKGKTPMTQDTIGEVYSKVEIMY